MQIQYKVQWWFGMPKDRNITLRISDDDLKLIEEYGGKKTEIWKIGLDLWREQLPGILLKDEQKYHDLYVQCKYKREQLYVRCTDEKQQEWLKCDDIFTKISKQENWKELVEYHLGRKQIKHINTKEFIDHYKEKSKPKTKEQ